VNDSSFLCRFCQNNTRCRDDPRPDETLRHSLRHSEFLPTIGEWGLRTSRAEMSFFERFA
jgi:hypothetical protein